MKTTAWIKIKMSYSSLEVNDYLFEMWEEKSGFSLTILNKNKFCILLIKSSSMPFICHAAEAYYLKFSDTTDKTRLEKFFDEFFEIWMK